MNKYAYLFEARGIQRFLFSTGKLKDMVNGSELIDYICSENGYVDQLLKSLGLDESVKAPRKAGGAFYLVFEHEKDAIRFRAMWRLLSSQRFPSVECVDTLSHAETVKKAISSGLKQLAQSRNQINIELPNASPITERSPRTGLAAVKRENIGLAGKESIDIATSIIRSFKRPLDNPSLGDRFLSEDGIFWPNNFEEDAKESKKFPLGKRSLIGLVHADGNGLGEILRLLDKACEKAADDTYIDLYQTFSAGITKATVAAAQQASKTVLQPNHVSHVLPARPLVLGGDDLSIIIRADLALPFTQEFLVAFKQTSQTEIALLKDKFSEYNLASFAENLPDYLTACAGIVFMKASQPFYSAYSLAEGLCKRAKNYSRQHKKQETSDKVSIIPSSIAFYKVNDSVLEDIDVMYDNSQVATHKTTQFKLSLPAYLVNEKISGCADLEKLIKLEQFLKNSSLNDRALREFSTLIYMNLSQAKQLYKRWNQFSEREALKLSVAEQKMLTDIHLFKDQLSQLVGVIESDIPFNKVNEKEYQTVLGDLLTLFTISEEIYQKNNKAVRVS